MITYKIENTGIYKNAYEELTALVNGDKQITGGYCKSPLTKKQKKARAKSKRTKKAKKFN